MGVPVAAYVGVGGGVNCIAMGCVDIKTHTIVDV
jgi:hypothetical protein